MTTCDCEGLRERIRPPTDAVGARVEIQPKAVARSLAATTEDEVVKLGDRERRRDEVFVERPRPRRGTGVMTIVGVVEREDERGVHDGRHRRPRSSAR